MCPLDIMYECNCAWAAISVQCSVRVPTTRPYHTIIFLFLNSNMIQDLPTSCPAPLQGKEQTLTLSTEHAQYRGTHRGLIVSRSLSSDGGSPLEALLFVAILDHQHVQKLKG